MIKSLQTPSFYISLLLCIYGAAAQEVADSDTADECSSQPIEDYNMGLRVGALFIILVTSALGVFVPMILHRISPYKQGDIRDWILTFGKFFGTGVILATAFVHMLPDALENFSSPCLTDGWLSYGAFAGVFCMIASFALQLLEIVTVTHLKNLSKKKQEAIECELGDAGHEIDEKTLSQNKNGHIMDHGGHCHSALLEEDEHVKHIGTYILELGIVMHSVLIGITLSTTSNDEFITLLIALVFHQFFEGVALGTRLNSLTYAKWYKPALMGSLYIVMTPIGVAIGLGIHSSFNPNSYSSVLSQAILDSLSAGILLYNAYVSLMSIEISHNDEFHNYSNFRKIFSFASMYIGAGLMSLLGKWA
ncbi:Zinc/iron permease [Backusella circina FSU 941]|nr:Zinc/iron permease [Backusella circina FSU 941]